MDRSTLFASFTVEGNDLTSSAGARAYYDAKHATEEPTAPAPIPARTLSLDPAKLQAAQDSHDWIMRKFEDARRGQRQDAAANAFERAARAGRLNPAEAKRLLYAHQPRCTRCGVMHDHLHAGLCPSCR